MVPGTGLLAACVPGTFESWMMLLRDYGTMRVRDVLEPAISYARDGYPLVERACATIQTVEQLFREHWPTSAAVYLPERRSAEARHALHQQDAGRDLCPHSAAKPKAAAATATPRSSAREKPGRRASLRKPSTSSAARRK